MRIFALISLIKSNTTTKRINLHKFKMVSAILNKITSKYFILQKSLFDDKERTYEKEEEDENNTTTMFKFISLDVDVLLFVSE